MDGGKVIAGKTQGDSVDGLNKLGAADVLAIAFMFILLIASTMIIHAYSFLPLNSAMDRQIELKTEHIYKTLELAHVYPYAISYSRAACEILLLSTPTIAENILRLRFFEILEFVCPSGYGIYVNFCLENNSWGIIYPEGSNFSETQFTKKGTITLAAAGGAYAIVKVELHLFKL
jgi:1-acyl-sn-glycerol-3-phosphate acyltransferase